MTSKILTITGYDPATPDQWSAVSNLDVQDGAYASYSIPPNIVTPYILGVADASQITVGSTIDGIALRVRRNNPDNLNHTDYSIYIMNKSTLATMSSNYADGAWPNGTSDGNYGGASDMWGSVGVDCDFINSGNFAIGFQGIKIGGSLYTVFNLDYFEITIYYTEGVIPPAPVASLYGPEIQVI